MSKIICAGVMCFAMTGLALCYHSGLCGIAAIIAFCATMDLLEEK